eukprot:TRINITY_DN1136_c0_g1_i3.p1 TRINITY_DN1136_c0_g1~~TRINITY_DN1136_c0_g1_i3.p1  ORF type:complete len:256 (+),score=60.73 TRINITY_DN1136_c0_g1_i3:57-824(+)
MENRNINNSTFSQHTLEQNIDIRLDNVTELQPPRCIRTVKCSASIQKSTLKLVKEGDGTFCISFRYDSELDCTANFYFAAKEDPKITLLDKEIPIREAPLPKGINMEYKSSKITIDPLRLLVLTKDQPNAYGVIIALVSPQTEYTQQSYIKISEKAGECVLQTVKQTLESRTESIMLFDIYGRSEENPSTKVCVVCMANPADCFLLPCRHLILCVVCIGKVISEFKPRDNPCPLCRTNIIYMINTTNGEILYSSK